MDDATYNLKLQVYSTRMSNDLDQCLKQLAIEAQQHLPNTLKRQLAVQKLLIEIERSGKLKHPTAPPQFRGHLYQEIYAVAKQRLFCYMNEKIDNYDQNREVLQWANFLLEKRFPDAIREVTQVCQGLDLTKIKRLTLDDLDMEEITVQKDVEEGEIVRYLEEDPEGIFQAEHIPKYPHANFQFIALQVAFGYSFKEISDELQLPYQTVMSFYKRRLVKFKSKFDLYLLA